MRSTRYPAARAVADTIHEHFAARQPPGAERAAPLPEARTVERILEAAFWASLRREEGRAPRISLAYLPPEAAGRPLVLERPLALNPGDLSRMAPAVEGAGIHLGVWHHGDSLRVWGTTRSIPALCFVTEVVEPGLIVVKHRRGDEFDKFGNVAVLQGDQVKVIDEGGASLPDCPVLLHALLSFDAGAPVAGEVNVLVQLAVSMRGHGRGGSLMLVPAGSEAWLDSVSRPPAYAVRQAPCTLAELLRGEPPAHDAPLAWREALNRAVDEVAGLTAVDGATVLTDEYQVRGFGVKLARRGSERVERVAFTEPVAGNVAQVVEPGWLGGTRHLSAAQFVFDQRDTLALVASQDGRFTVFAWSPCEEMVHAHRVDALLM